MVEVKKAYTQDHILKYNCAKVENSETAILDSFNDIIESVAQFTCQDQDIWHIVKCHSAHYLVQESQISHDAAKFLKGFVPKLGGLLILDQTQESKKFKQFVNELSLELF